MAKILSDKPPQGQRGIEFDPPGICTFFQWAMAQPDPAYLIKQWVPSDEITILVGEPKTGHKTWFALLLALVAASGKTFFGVEPSTSSGIPVLFLEQEGGYKAFGQRLAAFSKALGLNLEEFNPALEKNLVIAQRTQMGEDAHMLQIDNKADRKAIKELIERDETKLVFIDTFAKIHRGDENSAKDISSIFRYIDELRGCPSKPAFVLLHHTRKLNNVADISNVLETARGSSAINAAVGHIVGFYQRKEEQRYLNAQVKARNGHDTKHFFFWDIAQDENEQITDLSFQSFEFAADKPLPPSIRTEYLEPLAPGTWYTPKSLAGAWEETQGDCRKMAKVLTSLGELEYDADKKRWRLSEGA